LAGILEGEQVFVSPKDKDQDHPLHLVTSVADAIACVALSDAIAGVDSSALAQTKKTPSVRGRL
jgi:hypothetical protein